MSHSASRISDPFFLCQAGVLGLLDITGHPSLKSFLVFFVCFKLGLLFAHCITDPITFLEYNKIPKVYSSFLTEPQNCISYTVWGNLNFPFFLCFCLSSQMGTHPPSFAPSINFLYSLGFEAGESQFQVNSAIKSIRTNSS